MTVVNRIELGIDERRQGVRSSCSEAGMEARGGETAKQES